MSEDGNKLTSFYVVYILSAGLIDDLSDLLTLIDPEWDQLPVQFHLINLSARNIQTDDLDTTKFQDYTMKVNLQQSCWLQFNVHYYDKFKLLFDSPSDALRHLCDVCVDSVPKDIESFMFTNQIVGTSDDHNRSEIVQMSLQHVIETMEKMNEEIKQEALQQKGIQGEVVDKMIESQRLFEWNVDTIEALNGVQ